MEIKKCIFLSDLHIETDKEIEKFLKFIKKTDASAIFLLGDIFEFFAYDNSICVKKYEHIINELKEISLQGKKVVVVEGNHDFALNGKFVSESKIEISEKEYRIDLNGKGAVLIHGDVFFMNRIFKSILTSKITKIIIKFIPENFVMKLGFWFSSLGKNKREIVKEEMIERQIRYLLKMFKDSAEILISGHLHKPLMRKFLLGDKTLLWINPGGPDYFCEYCDGDFYIKPY